MAPILPGPLRWKTSSARGATGSEPFCCSPQTGSVENKTRLSIDGAYACYSNVVNNLLLTISHKMADVRKSFNSKRRKK